MSKRLILLACIVTIPGIVSAPAVAGVDYADPAGDWDYMFDGAEKSMNSSKDFP